MSATYTLDPSKPVRYTLLYVASGAHDSHAYTHARANRLRNMMVRWYPELGRVLVVPVPTAPAPG